MSDFEKAKNLKTYYANKLSEIFCYGWSDQLCKSEALAAKSEALDEIGTINLSDLSKDQLFQLGFSAWDDSGLMLIPLWLYCHLPSGLELTSIGGDKVKVSDGYSKRESDSYIDNDVRYGCIAYGFIPN